jgi:xylulose-5-phosphate/fructose-6-phosphate phosphoketolase
MCQGTILHGAESPRNDVPKLGAHATYAKQAMGAKLLEHREYITAYGEDLPEVRY